MGSKGVWSLPSMSKTVEESFRDVRDKVRPAKEVKKVKKTEKKKHPRKGDSAGDRNEDMGDKRLRERPPPNIPGPAQGASPSAPPSQPQTKGRKGTPQTGKGRAGKAIPRVREEGDSQTRSSWVCLVWWVVAMSSSGSWLLRELGYWASETKQTRKRCKTSDSSGGTTSPNLGSTPGHHWNPAA